MMAARLWFTAVLKGNDMTTLNECNYMLDRLRSARDELVRVRAVMRPNSSTFWRDIDKLLQLDVELRRLKNRINIEKKGISNV